MNSQGDKIIDCSLQSFWSKSLGPLVRILLFWICLRYKNFIFSPNDGQYLRIWCFTLMTACTRAGMDSTSLYRTRWLMLHQHYLTVIQRALSFLSLEYLHIWSGKGEWKHFGERDKGKKHMNHLQASYNDCTSQWPTVQQAAFQLVNKNAVTQITPFKQKL